MPSVNSLRKEGALRLLDSPFLSKNAPYTLHDATLDVDVLLSFLLKKNRALLIASLQEDASSIKDDFFTLVDVRFKGKATAYIIEEKEFYCLPFYVNENVLIPKSDTEILVELAINDITKTFAGKIVNIMDVFTGSGCIAVSVAKNICSQVKATFTVIDICEKALSVAEKNAKKLLAEDIYRTFFFLQHDGTHAFPLNANKYNVIMANPPYVPSKETLQLLSDGRGEPSLALDGGMDGYHFFYSLAKNAHIALETGGMLFCEVGDGQAKSVSKIFMDAGFTSCTSYPDLSGVDRVIKAIKM